MVINLSLHGKQSVAIDDVKRLVHFRHHVTKDFWRGVKLTWNQFHNLNDILKDLQPLLDRGRYPLGGGVWVHCYKPIIAIKDGRHNYFQFYKWSYETYIKDVQPLLHSFIRNVEQSQGDQPHATNGHRLQSRSRKSLCDTRRYKDLYRSPRNGACEN